MSSLHPRVICSFRYLFYLLRIKIAKRDIYTVAIVDLMQMNRIPRNSVVSNKFSPRLWNEMHRDRIRNSANEKLCFLRGYSGNSMWYTNHRRWSKMEVWESVPRCRKSRHLRHRIDIRRKAPQLRILIMLLIDAN